MPRRTLNTAPSEKEVCRLLASGTPEDDAALRHWLASPPLEPPDAVVTLVARIAKDARSHQEQWKIAALPFGPLLILTFTISLLLLGVKVPQQFMLVCGLVSPLVTVPLVFCLGAKYARAAQRAAFILAEIGDERAVTCLANLWTPRPLGKPDASLHARAGAELMRLVAARAGAELMRLVAARAGAELMRLVAARAGERFDAAVENALRRLIERAFPRGRWARLALRLRPQSDLTEADLDLLLVTVRHLSHVQLKKVGCIPTADEASLWRVASSAGAGTHYDLLRETAQVLILQHARRQTP